MSETLQPISLEEIEKSKARGEASKWNVGPDGEPLSEGYTMNDLGKVVWVGEGPEPTEKVDNSVDTIPEEETISEPSANEKLWKGLSERGFYSESYEHFKNKFSTPAGQTALYEAMKKQKLVSKDAGAFMNTFFPITEETTEEVETTESTEEESSTVTPEVYNVKPKNAEEVQQSLFTLKDSIDGKNEIVTNRTVKKYFEEPLKGFDKWLEQNHKLKTKKVGSRYTTVPLSNEEREKYLKEYLGEQKYNEYVAWDNGNGELPTDSKDFDNVLNKEISERQKERQQEYLRTIPEQLRQDALVMMPDIFGGFMNLQTEVQSEDDAREWDELYNPNGDNPLRGFKQRRAKGRDGEWKLFTPPAGKAGSLDAGNKDYEKNIKLQSDYITNSYNSFKKDSKAYEDSVTAWNNENKGFTDKLTQLELNFKKLGNIDKDSSQESIDAHNALVGDYKNLVQRMKSSGLDQKGTELTNLQTSLKNRFDDLMDKSEKFEDISMASAALGLNYDFGERLALQLESAAMDIGVLATGTLSALAEVSRILPGDQQEMEFYEHINNNYKASINYNESVKNKIQTSLPKAITWETRKGNIGAYAADMLANNSPSILTAIGSGGFGSLVTKGMSRAAAIATRKKLMKAPMAIFFGMEGGAKLADMEIAKKNAPKAIAFFDQELLRTDLSPAERQELLGLRSEQENALNVNQFQKAFSTIGYGGIAMYAERFGTLSYVNGLNRFAKTAAIEGIGKKILYGGANNIFNVGIELLEETGTQLGHNLIDITVLDQDKSMIEGIDTEFLVNVAFSSLAIQGPSMGMNSYNAIKGEVKSRQDINRDNKLAAELNEIQNVLSEGIGINAKDRKTLVARKREILEEAALNDIISLQRASRMTPQEVEQLFEINRENRKDIKTLRELGQSGEEISAIKNRKDEIADRINKRNEKRETLLSRDSQRRRAKLKELQKKGQITDGKLMTDASGKDIAVDLKTGDVVGTEEYLDPSAEFWLARHEYNEDIIRGLGNNVLNFKGENARENLVKYLDTKDLMGVEKAQVLLGFDQGAYGTNIGSDAILFESSILRSIGEGGFAAKMASATALHETLHIQNRKAGIVKDNNIVEAARTAVGEIKNRINELAELGEISKEDKAEIDRRIKSYDGMTGVMLEELVNLAGDLKAAGIMGRESLSLVYAFKSLLNRAISKFNGGNDMFFTFKTVDDVLRYIDSFQGKLAKGDIALPPEEEVETVGKQSKAVTPLEAINDLIPKNIKTKKEFNAFVQDRRLFPPVFTATMDNGVISNYVKSRSIGDEYRGAIESVQNRITNFDPEATRADGSIVGPEGFGEFIFANTRFGKLDSKKALAIKAEKQKQEVRGDQVTETGKTVFEGLVSEEPGKKKKAEPKGQKRREIQSLSNVYGIANEIGLNNKIQALIEQDPKNLEAAIKDLIQKDIRKTIAKQMGKISKIQGEVVVSDEYKAFLAFNYANIVQGLDVATIKNNYNQLFELTEIGKEDRRTRKSDKPSLKKDSNYRKSIYKIETNKAKFTKFFTEGGYTTLLDRQKKLAILISESIVEDIVNDQIIENSNSIDTLIQAELRDYSNKLNRQKKEVRGNYNDQIKFSKTVKAFAADIQLIENPTFDKIKTLYTEKYATTIDRKILDDIEKIFERLGPKITVNEFREAAGDAVITRGKGINFTFYDSIKEFLSKAFPEGNVKELDLMTEGGETSFMSGLKGLTALMDPRVLNLSLITNTFLAGNSLYTYNSGTRVNSKGKTVPKSISKNEILSKYNTKGKQDFKGDLKKAKGISSEKLDKVADLVEEYNNKPQTEANQKELAGKIRKLITQENIDAIHSVRDYFYNKLNEYVNQFEEGSVQYYEAVAFATKLLQIQTNASSGISRQGAVLNSVTLDYSTTRKKPRGKGIKRYQFEHNIQLLNFNTNVLKSITDNKFNEVYPLVSSRYSATLLDSDAQLVLDSKDGVTTKEFDKKYPGYKAATTGKTKAAPGFMIGMDSEAMFMIALGNAERTLHIPSGLMYDKLLYNKINRNATLDYLDGVAKKIDSNIKFSKSKKTVFDPANSNKIFKNSKNKSIFNSILQKSIIQEDVTQEIGELAVRIDNSKFFDKVKSEETLQADKALNNAIQFSRSANNETKGITVLDFDDTLATTKSGVRAKIPNMDGLPKPQRKVIFLAGGAGSGKGNVISKLGLKDQGFKVVNSDISLEWLKKNNGLPANMNDFTEEQKSKLGSLQHQARGIAKRKMMKYRGDADGVVVDGTGGSIKSMEGLVNEFKDKGYDVSMVFVETSLPVALERNAARKERSLLDKIVTKNHEAVQGNKDGFKTMFGDRFMEVNTDNLSQQDAMPAKLTDKMNDFVSSYENRRLDAEEFASEGADILEQGGTFDFSEFNKVVEGQKAPLFEKAMKLQGKFGPKDMFVLTARPAEAAPHIHEFLKANGLNIPLKNITGLANSTSEAKALWIADKVGEGYNDFYFADDAIQNVQAVQNMLDQFDVKSKVQQARADFVYGDPQVVRLIEESSKNDVKDVDRLTKPGTYNNIKFSKSHRAEYEKTISKSRPDLVKDKLVSKTVDNMFDFIDNLDVATDKKRKYEKITTKWLATSNVKLGEDSYKIQQAVEIAEKHKEDIFSYRNPNEIIEKYAGKTKTKPTNPKNVKEFGEGRVFNKKHGITVHEVENTGEGQKAVRDIIDTHWGKDSNPWCITQVKDGKLTDDAWQNWTIYDKSKKYIVFQNGKLSSFYADNQYWDRMDSPTDAPVIQVKEGNVTKKVELVPVSNGKVSEFVMETRTVSKDKKTVTTEILAQSEHGYEVGTKIVENRVNGVTVKSTRSLPGFISGKMRVLEIINFDKKGKATNNITFDSNGATTAVNRYGTHFGEMSVNDIVMEKGDLLSHEMSDSGFDYYHGKVRMTNQVTGKPQVTEIGWQAKEGTFDLRDAIKTVDGKVRVDLKKILEVDPDAKGLPKKVAGSKIMFSKGMNMEFNDILEGSTGVESIKEFSDAQARLRGQKTKYKSIIPASAQDFQGLLYNFLGKGKKGEADMAFFKKALIDPFARSINELNASRQSAANDFENLNKNFPDVKKKLNKSIEGLDYTNDQAMRVYLWNKAGFEVPGLSKRDLAALTSVIENNPEMKAYADAIGLISKKENGYSKPKDYWLAESIASDLLSDGAIGDLRADLLAEWIQNKNIIFSKENLNKIEAIYGSKFREALEDILYRMETGRNRPVGGSRLVNGYMNWVNNSVGAIMFLNLRSATLQTISATNYVNWTDNNPLKAAAAFADQKQFWSDFSMIWNSPYLKQRRSGNQRGINEAELSEAVAGSDNKAKAALAWLLKKGFTPTQLADSFAISMGGATFLRNRIKKYVKEGMSQKDAEAKAWIDFQETTEVNQQSARPDMISQQQASPLGRLILAFQNTPMQYARIMNKATRDLVNGRGDYKTHISKIAYYGFVQSVIFGALQSALYASLGDDEEEEFDKKKERILNQMVDSWLSGIGVGGKAIGTVKNTIMEYLEQRDKGFNADHAYTLLTLLSFSPPIGSKLRKIYSSIKTEEFNRGVFSKRGFSLDNPIWSGVGNVIEGVTNAPLGRMANLMLQLDNAMDSSHQWWERVALILGQNTWDLGIKDPDIEAIKGELKEEKKEASKKKSKIKKEEKKKIDLKEKEAEGVEKQKKEKKEGKEVTCLVCKLPIVKGKKYCTIHEKKEQNKSGKKKQCRKYKKDGSRCKVETSNKSGYCYYHD